MQTQAGPYAAVSTALEPSPFSKIYYRTETASTNADASALLGNQQQYGLSIVAEHQTAGSGRKGRSWISSPQRSLLVTTILPKSMPANDIWLVPFWAALAVRDALMQSGVVTHLQWPNDLLLDDKRKIAGILCISRIAGDDAWVACGVGINVRRPAAGAPEIQPPAAYCDDVTPVDRGELLQRILRNYDDTLALLSNPPAVVDAWQQAAGLPGVRYRIVRDGEAEPFEAVAIALSQDGGLTVRRNGLVLTIALADARALR